MIAARLARVIQPGLMVIVRVPDQPARLTGLDSHQAGFDAWAWYTDPVRRRQGSRDQANSCSRHPRPMSRKGAHLFSFCSY